jgi:hypothetical protein
MSKNFVIRDPSGLDGWIAVLKQGTDRDGNAIVLQPDGKV